MGVDETTQIRTADNEAAATRLRAFIEERNFGPGDRLPSERALLHELGLNRAALRNALQDLEDEGKIWRHVGKGTFMSDPDGAEEQADTTLALSRRTTPVKMMAARLAIEPSIAREAAMNASAEALDRIAAAERATHAAGDWDAYEAADDDFHRAISEATDNIPLVAIFDRLNSIRRSVTWGAVQRQTPKPSRDHGSFDEHRRIAEAIANHDPDAAQALMRAHLKAVSVRLFGDF